MLQVYDREHGLDLAYAELASDQSTITTEVDLTGGSITFTVANRPVYVELFLVSLQQQTNAGLVTVRITDAANTQKGAASFTVTTAGQFFGLRVLERIATPGTYTRKGRLNSTVASVRHLGTSSVGHLRAFEG